MKRENLRENLSHLIALIAIFVLMSMTPKDRFKAASGAMLSVPAMPIATVYVRGTDDMYKYIKKGYQVQDVEVAGNTNPWEHMFLMVKYKRK